MQQLCQLTSSADVVGAALARNVDWLSSSARWTGGRGAGGRDVLCLGARTMVTQSSVCVCVCVCVCACVRACLRACVRVRADLECVHCRGAVHRDVAMPPMYVYTFKLQSV